jgi:hypothetical protein
MELQNLSNQSKTKYRPDSIFYKEKYGILNFYAMAIDIRNHHPDCTTMKGICALLQLYEWQHNFFKEQARKFLEIEQSNSKIFKELKKYKKNNKIIKKQKL